MEFSRIDRGPEAAHLASIAPAALISLAGVIALALPLRLFEATAPTPLIPLLAVYHWTATRPDDFPAPVILVLGFIQDLLLGAPLGLAAAAYLAVRWLTLTQSEFLRGREGGAMWAGMAVMGLAAGLIFWISASIEARGLAPVLPAVAQIGLTVLLYPLAALVFERAQRRVEAEAA